MASEPPKDTEGADYGRRRMIALLLGVAVVAVVVFGIVLLFGGEDEPETKADKIRKRDARAAEERTSAAERTVIRFVAAVDDEDFKTACDLVTDDVATQLGGECAEELGRLDIEITDVRVSGPKAIADIEVSLDDGPVQESSFELLELDEGWRVTQFGD